MTSAIRRPDPDRAARATAGELHSMQGVLMGVLSADMVRALSPANKDLVVRLSQWLADELRTWSNPVELSLVRAWTDLVSRTVRVRCSVRLWAEITGYPEATARVEAGDRFRGIELNYFQGYERNVIPVWKEDAIPVIPGSQWQTVAAGVQIQAHPTEISRLLIRYAQA